MSQGAWYPRRARKVVRQPQTIMRLSSMMLAEVFSDVGQIEEEEGRRSTYVQVMLETESQV